ncbi:hypothetical protein [Streptodolium elevatio]|uniref:Uncharacterized protein n=1 Tax=Streptodolium elevatio TaxID=3157996 RepID=A0ABV3DSB0_9ACTN
MADAIALPRTSVRGGASSAIASGATGAEITAIALGVFLFAVLVTAVFAALRRHQRVRWSDVIIQSGAVFAGAVVFVLTVLGVMVGGWPVG